jgi:hypothetical protein
MRTNKRGVVFRRGAVSLLALLGGVLPACAQGQAQSQSQGQVWETRWFNPNLAADDVTLPLPCGGRMVFRPIDVLAGAGPLDDKPLTMGSPDQGQGLGYADFIRGAFLAAPFPIPGGQGRRYYLGKYDVTHDQYDAMRGTCHPPTPAGQVAMNQVSFFDASQAAAQWSAWLLANARSQLPHRGAALAFARLPTEDEWEYAARGGARVNAEDFLAPTWPMPDGPERYIMSGSRAAAGHPQQIGLRLPNPLGLYDMLGNVGQMMLDPFRLNRVGREFGQAGGITVRGGDYTFEPAELSTAMRTEVSPFSSDTNAPTRLSTMGFRLALATTAVGDGESNGIRDAFDALSHRLGAQDSAGSAAQLLASLRDSATDAVMRQRLDSIGAAMASDRRARDDAAQVAIDSELEAAVVLAEYIWRLEHDAAIFEAMVPMFPPAERAGILAEAQTRRDWGAGPLNSYMQLLQQIVSLAPGPGEIESHAAKLRAAMVERQEHVLTAFIAPVQRHAVALRDHAALPPDQVQKDLVTVRTVQSGSH